MAKVQTDWRLELCAWLTLCSINSTQQKSEKNEQTGFFYLLVKHDLELLENHTNDNAQ